MQIQGNAMAFFHSYIYQNSYLSKDEGHDLDHDLHLFCQFNILASLSVSIPSATAHTALLASSSGSSCMTASAPGRPT